MTNQEAKKFADKLEKGIKNLKQQGINPKKIVINQFLLNDFIKYVEGIISGLKSPENGVYNFMGIPFETDNSLDINEICISE